MHIWVLKLKDAIKQSILLEAGCQTCQFFFFVSEHFASAPFSRRFDLLRQALGQQTCFFGKASVSTCLLNGHFSCRR